MLYTVNEDADILSHNLHKSTKKYCCLTLWGLLFGGTRRGEFIILPFGAGDCSAEILCKGEHAMYENTGNAQRVFNKFCGAPDKCGIT